MSDKINKEKHKKYIRDLNNDKDLIARLNKLQQDISYFFKDQNLLIEAITHPSIKNIGDLKNNFNYQRLEFLGDSILGFVIAEQLYNKFNDLQEGKLSSMKSKLVCKEAICKAVESLDLDKCLIMSFGEENSGGRENYNNIENCFESIVAAIYLDNGIESARKVILLLWKNLLDDNKIFEQDSKSKLQEILQSKGYQIPKYNIVENKGTSHSPLFVIELDIEGFEKLYAEGINKKQAEKNVAQLFLEKYFT